MTRATVATRLLSLALDRSQASALTGDLLELYPTPWRFTWAVLATFLRLTWRTLAGLALAYVILPGMVRLDVHSVKIMAAHGRALPDGPDAHWIVYAIPLFYIAILLAPAAIYALVRFGPRHVHTQVAFVLNAVAFASCWFFWQPAARLPLLDFLAVALLFCLSSASRRVSVARLVGGATLNILLLAASVLLSMRIHGPILLYHAVAYFLGAIIYAAPLVTAWSISRQGAGKSIDPTLA